ncbi:MAG: hemerythrin domain-containing protein [Acidobacteriota bacterium]
MNALTLLIVEHDELEALFKQVERSDLADRKALFVKIRAIIESHSHIEEMVLYRYMLESGEEDLRAVVKEGIEKHRKIKGFMQEISSLRSDAEEFEEKLKMFMEFTRHHVEKEETVIFTKITKHFEPAVLYALGAKMDAAKRNFVRAADDFL